MGATASALFSGQAYAEDARPTIPSSPPWIVPSAFGSRVLVSATLNDRAAWLHLDTGSSVLAVSASALGLSGADTQSEPRSRVPVNISIGVYNDVVTQYQIIDYDVVDAGHRLGGIIGGPFFEKCVVNIDFKSKRVLAWNLDQPYPDTNGAQAEKLYVARGVPSVEVAFETKVARMLLDTGSDITILLSHFASTVMRGSDNTDYQARLGYGRPLTRLHGVTTASLRFGRLKILRPFVLVPEVAPPFLVASGYDGIIGRDILREAPFTLDYSRGIIYF